MAQQPKNIICFFQLLLDHFKGGSLQRIAENPNKDSLGRAQQLNEVACCLLNSSHLPKKKY